MADQKYLTALQPFIALAKNAGPVQTADIIRRATEAPDCYVFSELLEQPSVQKLVEHDEYAKWFYLLRIFAYGSYPDYISQQQTLNLPTLSDLQLLKLKQLTLVTLSSKGGQNLTYTSLLYTLDLPTVRSLEDIIISAIYASLLDAKLDTANQRIEVSSTAGRDVAPGDILNIIGTLDNWCKQCEGVLRDIDEQIAEVQRLGLKKSKELEDFEAAVRARKAELFSGGTGNKASSSVTAIPHDVDGGNIVSASSGSGNTGTTPSSGKGKRVISEGEESLQGAYNDSEMEIDDGPSAGDAPGSSSGGGSSGGGGSGIGGGGGQWGPGYQGGGGTTGGRKRKGLK